MCSINEEIRIDCGIMIISNSVVFRIEYILLRDPNNI